ncbi:hypothetical protein [Acinetobacter sp. GN11]
MKEFFIECINFYKTLFSFRNIVYMLTLQFFLFLIILLALPLGEDNTLHLGNLHIKFESINLGDLGGFLSGIFAPLAFLWLMLNMKQQDKNLEIAERQLSILLKEKENRRKITRAQLKTLPTKPEEFVSNATNLYFKIGIISNSPLVDCYTNGFISQSKFSLIFSSSKAEINLSTTKKNINKDEVFYLNIMVDISSLKNERFVLEDNIEINYLDIDGFEQNQTFKVIFYLPESNPDNPNFAKMYAILLLQPHNY